jgi:septum formation protein
MHRLILASTSPYRRALLARLRLPFDAVAPAVDETPYAGEAPVALARRLADMKAHVVASGNPEAWTIGSDQVVDHNGTTLGKPGSRERAIAQLTAMSGERVDFHTALVLTRAGGPTLEAVDTTRVRFRTLSDDEIARYVDAETPFDCAGSFKSEGLGIALFDAVESQDPTALIGLPLIATARLLREVGFVLP